MSRQAGEQDVHAARASANDRTRKGLGMATYLPEPDKGLAPDGAFLARVHAPYQPIQALLQVTGYESRGQLPVKVGCQVPSSTARSLVQTDTAQCQ